MNITNVKVKKIYMNPLSAVKAKVSVVVDNDMVLHNIKIIEKISNGEKSRFLAFPSMKFTALNESNKIEVGYYGMFYPINGKTRTKFEKAIYDAVDNLEKQIPKNTNDKGDV